jgi:hypothetical protein
MKIPMMKLMRSYRRLGFQPDSADTLPAWRTSTIAYLQAGSLPAETGKMPILRRKR